VGLKNGFGAVLTNWGASRRPPLSGLSLRPKGTGTRSGFENGEYSLREHRWAGCSGILRRIASRNHRRVSGRVCCLSNYYRMGYAPPHMPGCGLPVHLSASVRHVVDTGRQMRQEGRHPLTGFAMLLEWSDRWNQPVWRRGERRNLAYGSLRRGTLLPGVFMEGGLVLKCIYLADAALHKQEDAALSFRWPMRRLRSQRAFRPEARALGLL
jgi:hypothetical protein